MCISLCMPFFVLEDKRGDKMVKVNGKEANHAVGMTIKDYLRENNYRLNFIAVEKNGVIVPKTEYENNVINDGDTIEIVNFVGGG